MAACTEVNDVKDVQSEKDLRNIPLKHVGIKGLRWPIALRDKARGTQHSVAEVTLAVDLPHDMRGTPKNMQQNCEYKDVVQEVAVYLAQRAQLLRERGVSADKIILDPGIGFAKNVEQNLLLMRDLKALTSFGYPVLLAVSRKSTLGAVLGGVPAEQRLEGTIATSLQAIYAGAQMVRVHDVEENVRAIRTLEAILRGSAE